MKSHHIFAVPGLFMVIAVLLSVFIVSWRLWAPEAQATAAITLDPTTQYQTINGWEVADYTYQASAAFPNFVAQVLDGAVNDVGINRIRLEIKSGVENATDYWSLYHSGQIDYATWRCNRYATLNDNANPNTINSKGFKFSELDWKVDNIVNPLKHRVEARGEHLFINLHYVAFTGQMCGGSYIHNNPAEYAEFVLATYQHLQSKYGWVPDAWAVILEPDNVSQWSGMLIGQSIVAAAARLQANGFAPHFIAPSNTDMSNVSSYVDAAAAVSGALAYWDEISYHRYRGVSAIALQNIVTRAQQHGKRASMLEWWHSRNSYAVLHEDLKRGINSAWQWGALAGTNGHTDLYWINDATLTNPQITIAAGTKFLRQYFKFIRAGAVRIGATTGNSQFDPLAFVNTDGKYVVVIKAATGGAFAIGNLPAGTYGVKYTTSTQYDRDLTDVVLTTGQNLKSSIPAAGVITIYGTAG
jgi:hypothetical protein